MKANNMHIYVEHPNMHGFIAPFRMSFASGWRRQAREESAVPGEKKTISLDGVSAKFKVNKGAYQHEQAGPLTTV